MSTRWLLGCGIAAGPLFVLVVLVQAATRAGFRVGHHPLSLLSLGGLGWIQVANFVVAGGLYLFGASGVWRALPGGRWVAAAVAGIGAGLIAAGVCVTDAGAGFPPGTPDRAPERMSWHGIVHEVGFGVTTVAWLALCLMWLRRCRAAGNRRGALACGIVLIAVLGVAGWPDLSSLSVRLLAATAIQFGFVSLTLSSLSTPAGGTR